MEAAQKDRDKINGKDGMEKYFGYMVIRRIQME